MSLPALATPSELGTWLNTTIASDDARALAVLAAASSLVRSAAGQTWETGDIPQDAVTVTLTAAARVWSNPTGARAQSTGPFSAEWAGLLLTDEERLLLGRFRSTSGGLYTIATTRTEGGLPDRYLEVVGSELIPHVPIEDPNW